MRPPQTNKPIGRKRANRHRVHCIALNKYATYTQTYKCQPGFQCEAPTWWFHSVFRLKSWKNKIPTEKRNWNRYLLRHCKKWQVLCSVASLLGWWQRGYSHDVYKTPRYTMSCEMLSLHIDVYILLNIVVNMPNHHQASKLGVIRVQSSENPTYYADV